MNAKACGMLKLSISIITEGKLDPDGCKSQEIYIHVYIWPIWFNDQGDTTNCTVMDIT